MSTSYYLITQHKHVKEKYFNSCELTDEPTWGYEIEIATISSGYIPLFYPQEKAFNSYKELKSLIATEHFILYDEYLRILNWEQFDSIIQNHMRKANELLSHLSDKSVYDKRWYKDAEGYEFYRVHT